MGPQVTANIKGGKSVRQSGWCGIVERGTKYRARKK